MPPKVKKTQNQRSLVRPETRSQKKTTPGQNIPKKTTTPAKRGRKKKEPVNETLYNNDGDDKSQKPAMVPAKRGQKRKKNEPILNNDNNNEALVNRQRNDEEVCYDKIKGIDGAIDDEIEENDYESEENDDEFEDNDDTIEETREEAPANKLLKINDDEGNFSL